MPRILLLGGTSEASALARALAGADADAVFSYAGRTGAPVAPLRTQTSDSGSFRLSWRPLAPEVPTNEPFELAFLLERDGVPVPGATVAVRGWMPEHGHGMLRRPEVEDEGDGWYRVRGMLLHMGGFWELFFDVFEPGQRKDSVRFEVRL